MRVTAAMRLEAPLLAYSFDGATYSSELDGERLSTQMDRVRALMADRKWRTLAEIQAACGGSEAGVHGRGGRLMTPKRVRRFLARLTDVRQSRQACGYGAVHKTGRFTAEQVRGSHAQQGPTVLVPSVGRDHDAPEHFHNCLQKETYV